MSKKEYARLTIDMPLELRRKLKMACAGIEKSMRDLVIEAIVEKVRSLEAATTMANKSN